MGFQSGIQWTDHTFNPWWGCQRVSPGCEHCYAESFAKRIGHGARLPVIWGPPATAERKFFGDAHWAEPLQWNAWAARDARRARVFCASMADVFEDRVELTPYRARLAGLIRRTPHLDWLLLTKRPENAARLWAGAWSDAWDGSDSLGFEWAPNIWLGTTVEDQRRAYERIPELISVPACVRFLSCEPLLEAVNLARACPLNALHPHLIDWVIVGGESGPRAREFRASWARDLIAQCRSARVAVFMKQFGTYAYDDITWRGSEPRYTFEETKGGDPSEWPREFQVREVPDGR
jgi:protein gp37